MSNQTGAEISATWILDPNGQYRCSACGKSNEAQRKFCPNCKAFMKQNNPVKIWLHNCNGLEKIYMIVDEETGVNYIGYSSGDMRGGCAITPRLNADGTLYVSK